MAFLELGCLLDFLCLGGCVGFWGEGFCGVFLWVIFLLLFCFGCGGCVYSSLYPLIIKETFGH